MAFLRKDRILRNIKLNDKILPWVSKAKHLDSTNVSRSFRKKGSLHLTKLRAQPGIQLRTSDHENLAEQLIQLKLLRRSSMESF